MDTGGNDDIPVVERYRGCGLHDCQSIGRLRVVRAAIDHVYRLDQVLDLVEHAGNVRNPPESRLLAVARCRALWELAQEAREPRPIISLAYVEALVQTRTFVLWFLVFFISAASSSGCSAARQPRLCESGASGSHQGCQGRLKA